MFVLRPDKTKKIGISICPICFHELVDIDIVVVVVVVVVVAVGSAATMWYPSKQTLTYRIIFDLPISPRYNQPNPRLLFVVLAAAVAASVATQEAKTHLFKRGNDGG